MAAGYRICGSKQCIARPKDISIGFDGNPTLMIKPETIIRVRFLTPEEGGRKSSIKGSQYGCPIMVNNQGFDCRLVLDDRACFDLGETYEIPVKFLNPDLAYKDIREGIEISLWEGKTIAKGIVLEILN